MSDARSVALLVAAIVVGPAFAQSAPKPSHPAVPHCAWERFSDPEVGLAAWVQRCDYGARKIDFVARGTSLAIRFSDGGAPDPLVDMFLLQPHEAPTAGIRRVFAERTDPAIARRCVLVPYRRGKAPSGAKRFTFVPDAAYRKALRAHARPDEVPDPPCGEWGVAPDGIQYFQVWPQRDARRFAFVRVGQDEPLFDELTLQPLPSPLR